MGRYEFSFIPTSLFRSDGLLLIPNDKSAIIHKLKSTKYKDKINKLAITKTTTMGYCSDFVQAFILSISKIMSGFKEDIFELYLTGILKIFIEISDRQ